VLDEGGWRAVVLSTPGSPLSPTISAFDPQGFDTTSLSQLYENMTLFDKTLSVHNGLAIANERALPEVWADLLDRTLPKDLSAEERRQAEAAASILFKRADDVDQVRHIEYLTEPSAEFRKYREFELIYKLIKKSQLQEDGSWRLHPRLSEYTSLDEAEESVLNDWLCFGRKQRIETAIADYRLRTQVERWETWTRARKRFDANRIQLDGSRWVARTFLYPPPASWISLSSWFHVKQSVRDGIMVEFEMARVKVIRPWLSLADVLEKKLRLNSSVGSNASFELSTGETPSFDKFPSGRLAVFAEEMLLVRNIRWSPADKIVQDHPFGMYTYPDSINLAAFIVRGWPAGLLK
jgi:hypothetical protein